MKTKKIYLVEYCQSEKGKLSEMFIDKIYANRHSAEIYFSENYLECLRVNKTTVKYRRLGMSLMRTVMKHLAEKEYIDACVKIL